MALSRSTQSQFFMGALAPAAAGCGRNFDFKRKEEATWQIGRTYRPNAALPRRARRVFAAIEAEIGDRSSASVRNTGQRAMAVANDVSEGHAGKTN
jgi:hypothetical protein